MPSRKIDLDTLQVVLQRSELDSRKIAEIMEDLNKQLQEMEEEQADRDPPVKKRFVPVISDPEGRLGSEDITGWVVQIPETDPPGRADEALQKIIQAAYEYNTTRKGRKMPATTIAEACETIPAKIGKEIGLWIKTREPVEFIVTDNTVPMEKTDKRVRHGVRGQEDF